MEPQVKQDKSEIYIQTQSNSSTSLVNDYSKNKGHGLFRELKLNSLDICFSDHLHQWIISLLFTQIEQNILTFKF